MNEFKKWFLSGIVFLISGIIMYCSMRYISLQFFSYAKYIILTLTSILTGFVVMMIVNKIESKIPTMIFAVYSTIVTGAMLIVTQIVSELGKFDLSLDQIMTDTTLSQYPGSVSPTHPIPSALIVFLGLNLAYWFYYFKQPEENWKDFIPHIIGIILVLVVYNVITGVWMI